MSEANKPHEEAVSPKDADGVAKGDTPLRITDGTAELDDAVPVEAKPLLRRRVDRTAKRSLADTPAFVCYVIQRFIEDRGLQTASSLTYTSLLGLVPIIAVFLAILSAFPALEGAREQVKEMILAPLVPGAGETVRNALETFLDNAKSLGTMGVIGIAVTSILMLNTIESTLNGIWRVALRRPLGLKLIVFWALLTLPPLLIAASLSLPSYFFHMANRVDVFGIVDIMEQVTPFLMHAVAFTFLFAATPNRRVRIRDALRGGLVASLLFGCLKAGFGFYVASATSNQTIYGALAVIPVFLLWIYLSWTVILIGAEVAAALPEWRGALAAEQRRRLTSGERLVAAVGILKVLWRASLEGRAVDRDDIESVLRGSTADLGAVVGRLVQLNHVVVTENGGLALTSDLDEVSLYALQRELGLALEETEQFRDAIVNEAPDLNVPELAVLMAEAEAAKAKIMARSIKRLADH
jgi:membrane protein